MNTKQPKSIHLEKTLTELEEIIQKMESKQLDLTESMELFEQGVHLTKLCQKALLDAEQKVTQLVQNDDKEELVDF